MEALTGQIETDEDVGISHQQWASLECDADEETLGGDERSLEWFGVLIDFKDSNEFFNLNIWPVF